MKWNYGNKLCLSVAPSEADLLEDILTSTHEALRAGLVTMSPSELVNFNGLCDLVELSLPPLKPENLPILRRIK